jgi:site-specific DNA-cytosine methylase
MKRRLEQQAPHPKARNVGSPSLVAMQIPKVDFERPSPLPAHQGNPPLAPGASYLSELFVRFLRRCTTAERADLASWVVNDLSGKIRVGSICSGTDVPVLAWQAFAVALRQELRVGLQVVHMFSAEKHTGKRRFLEVMFPENKLLFGDACELGNSSAYDCLSGERKQVPDDIDTGAAGWPCTDVSSLNNGAAHNRSVVMDGAKNTGGVFRGVRKFISNHGANLWFFLNENVTALARPGKGSSSADNLSSAVWLLRQDCDCWTKVWMLSPMDFGVPQSRNRLWFPCFPQARLLQLGLSEEEASDILSDIMSRLVGSQPIKIESYLLPPENPLHEHVMWQLRLQHMTSSTRRRRSPDDADAKWPNQHMQLFRERGLDWWPSGYPSPDTIAKYPPLAYAMNRDLDILQLHGVTFPEEELRMIEVSQSASRSTETALHVMTITPACKLYLTSKCRFIFGVELLRLQSIFFPQELQLTAFDDSLLKSLAGNAFEGSCCAATLFAASILVSKGSAARHSACKPAMPAEPAEHLATGSLESGMHESHSDLDEIWHPQP